MNPNGTGARKLTYNTGHDGEPTLAPDGTKIAYMSRGDQASNPEGDWEIYVMSALDGSGNRNLTDNGANVDDLVPVFSPDGQKIAFTNRGQQSSNPDGDSEVYIMSALDGSSKKNLSDNGVQEDAPDFSPDGTKIVYQTSGAQTSNPEGEAEVYVMSALEGTGKKNLSTNGGGIGDVGPVFSPDGQHIAYLSRGVQSSNPQGDYEIYRMNASDGSSKKNLTNNDAEYDESPEWGR
jgi:TolB protein